MNRLFGVLLALGFGASVPAHAGPAEIREALSLITSRALAQTYEGFAFRARLLGHVEYGEANPEELFERLEAPANRAVAEQLESRVAYLKTALAEGEAAVTEAAREALSLAPERVSGRTEFVPLSAEPEKAGYEALRREFLAAGEVRDVQIYLRGEYREFQPSILSRLESFGFEVKPIYRDSSVVLAGRAPERNLREMSGIDGVDHLTASGRSPGRGDSRPGLARQDFRHGAKAVTE